MTSISSFKNITLMFLLATCLATNVAQAQNKAPTKAASVSIAPEVRAILQPKVRAWLDSMEERARKVMGQQLADGHFVLYVKADISPAKFMALVNSKQGNTRLTTLPMDLAGAEKQKIVAENFTVEQVALAVGNITVLLTFDKDVPDAQANALKDALIDAIDLNIKTGDTVVIKKAPLVAPGIVSKIDNLNTKIADGSKDSEKLRYEMTLAQQKISQIEAERLKLVNDLKNSQDKTSATEEKLKEEKDKVKRLEEDMSVYKTPLGDIKKMIKGLELPLTILPIAFLLFIFAAIGFFLYLRLQGTKTSKFMQIADVMAQALSKAGKGNSNQGLTLDAMRTEFSKLTAGQNDEAAKTAPGQLTQGLLGEELASVKQESSDAWSDLKKYPYLTFAELREWLVGGGSQTQRFTALVNALGPVESMRLLQQFSYDDLLLMRTATQDQTSKLPGYAAILQLHRNVTSEAIRRPQCIAKLDFPELIHASDDVLATAIGNSNPTSIALCINLLPGVRKNKIFEALTPERQGECVDGVALLDTLSEVEVEAQIKLLKSELAPILTANTSTHLSAAEDITKLLEGSSPKARAALQNSLLKHHELHDKVTQKMVTFEDVLALDDDTVSELLEDFEPEQIAILVSGLKQESQKRIAKVLSRKVVLGVQNELQRISTRQAALKRAQAQSIGLQTILIDKLKALIDEGVVELKRKDRQIESAPTPKELEESA